MSATTRHAVSPTGRERVLTENIVPVGAEPMEGQHNSGMQEDGPPQLRNPFTGRSSPADSDIVDPEPSSQGESRRAESSPRATSSSPTGDRRLSKEWDAAKVPPSRFQKREGSIFSTSSSRDSHVAGKDRDASYHAKLKEKGWV
ncbi:hypothetical protein PRK78_006455 [Emydomyces testavorans]|uniref:Uncharacterized protein n=1 Tax=Emydomyces testavorans TaxID=2070801 RepID=A0AAF0DNI3_9EURO|nr:hypothetical protein PRK78_006455 [Emydomyces testavorans]